MNYGCTQWFKSTFCSFSSLKMIRIIVIGRVAALLLTLCAQLAWYGLYKFSCLPGTF